MSFTQIGRDWWQASDGRWYPPEQRPGNAPAERVPHTPPSAAPSPQSSTAERRETRQPARLEGWWQASDGIWYPPTLRPGRGPLVVEMSPTDTGTISERRPAVASNEPSTEQTLPQARARTRSVGRLVAIVAAPAIAVLLVAAILALVFQDDTADPIGTVSCSGLLSMFSAIRVDDDMRFTWTTARPITESTVTYKAKNPLAEPRVEIVDGQVDAYVIDYKTGARQAFEVVEVDPQTLSATVPMTSLEGAEADFRFTGAVAVPPDVGTCPESGTMDVGVD